MHRKKIWLQAFVLASVLALGLYSWLWWTWEKGPKQAMQAPLRKIQKWQAFETQGAPEVMWSGEKQGFAFTQKEESSETLRLSKQQQPIRIVHFWASWCGPCVEELPSLMELAKKLGPKQLIVLAISEDQTVEDMVSFLNDKGLKGISNFFFIFDDKKVKIIEHYGSERLPESFILDANMKLKKRIAGSIEWVTEQSLEYFKHLLNPSPAVKE